MAMNKEELIKYKESLEAELKAEELALKRVKSQVEHKRKYLKLCEEQIKMFDETPIES